MYIFLTVQSMNADDLYIQNQWGFSELRKDHTIILALYLGYISLKGIHNGRKTFDMLWRKLCLLRK